MRATDIIRKLRIEEAKQDMLTVKYVKQQGFDGNLTNVYLSRMSLLSRILEELEVSSIRSIDYRRYPELRTFADAEAIKLP